MTDRSGTTEEDLGRSGRGHTVPARRRIDAADRPHRETRLRAVVDTGTYKEDSRVPPEGLSASEFSGIVRRVLAVARRCGHRTPTFRSPPRIPEVDRTIQRRKGSTVVAIRRAGRPAAAVHADIIEGIVVANRLPRDVAESFRNEAWAALESHGFGEMATSACTTSTFGVRVPDRSRGRALALTVVGNGDKAPDFDGAATGESTRRVA